MNVNSSESNYPNLGIQSIIMVIKDAYTNEQWTFNGKSESQNSFRSLYYEIHGIFLLVNNLVRQFSHSINVSHATRRVREIVGLILIQLISLS